jgi:plasmid stability protein
MAQLLIRNLEDDVVEALKKRAAAQGKSLEQSLRDLLRDAALPEVARRLAIIDRIRAMGPQAKRQSDSTRIIRRTRDA